MLTKALAHAGQSRVGLLALGVITLAVALGTYLLLGRGDARASHPVQGVRNARPDTTPSAAGFAHVLLGVSNAFAAEHGYAQRFSHADCVKASRGHYMCSYRVARPGRPSECHLIQAEWGRERSSSFTVTLGGRVRKCRTLREAIRSLP